MSTALFEHVISRLEKLGLTGQHDGRYLSLTYDGISTRYRLEDGQDTAFREYIESSDGHFDDTDRSYVRNSELDIPLVRLDQDVMRDEEYCFSNDSGEEVIIRRARFSYMLAFFDSEAYKPYFEELVTKRLSRSLNYPRSINMLFRSPIVATYSSLLAVSATAIRPRGVEKIRSCLAKLAIERHVCFEFLPLFRRQAKLDSPEESDNRIPKVIYERNLINYYKVGRASPFPSQSFLAYYHVLEYYFLRVAEGVLHDRLRALLNGPSFQTTTDGIDKAISLVKNNIASDDETEMLRKVLNKFASEDDFISFIIRIEDTAKDKIYTKKRTLFGEAHEISPREGHAISNAAKLLKHVRNAIVHSSDKYTRDERHIPLTESESVIADYIPLVKYFAEKVIFGTATPGTNFI
jgi:hypothetical protein